MHLTASLRILGLVGIGVTLLLKRPAVPPPLAVRLKLAAVHRSVS